MTHITTERLKALAENDNEAFYLLEDAEVLEIVRELLQRRAADRWIPTSEALPENRERVLVHRDEYAPSISSAVYWKRSPMGTTGFFCGGLLSGVTHWRPLPEFKEEK